MSQTLRWSIRLALFAVAIASILKAQDLLRVIAESAKPIEEPEFGQLFVCHAVGSLSFLTLAWLGFPLREGSTTLEGLNRFYRFCAVLGAAALFVFYSTFWQVLF